MLISTFDIRTRERGAAIVESVVVIVALMFLTGLLVDVGIGLQRYGEVTDAVSRAVRNAASTPCTEVSPTARRETALASQIREAVGSVTGNPENLLSVTVLDSGFTCDRALFSPPAGSHDRPVLSTNVKIHFQCFFCFLVGGLDVAIGSRVPIEDTSEECGYPVSC